MTVDELITELEKYDRDAEVYLEPIINGALCDSVDYDECENVVYLN